MYVVTQEAALGVMIRKRPSLHLHFQHVKSTMCVMNRRLSRRPCLAYRTSVPSSILPTERLHSISIHRNTCDKCGTRVGCVQTAMNIAVDSCICIRKADRNNAMERRRRREDRSKCDATKGGNRGHTCCELPMGLLVATCEDTGH